ncbi:hypothetical protein E4U53_007482 [Claviceps sorghi]|nr:hypothetical protein E4U53_007482 [Claviceps sorghi]
MDDLSGLDWSKPTASQPKPTHSPMTSNPSYPSLRPTPSPVASGHNTPASQGAAASASAKAPANPAQQDSFSNLLSFAGQPRPKQNLSLAERQAQLDAEKRRKDEEKRRRTEEQFGSAQQWDALGSRAFSPSPSTVLAPPSSKSKWAQDDDDDLFAAFNKDTVVDNSSHYPPPGGQQWAPVEEEKKEKKEKETALDLTNPSAWGTATAVPGAKKDGKANCFDEDDDPFGLGELKPRSPSLMTATTMAASAPVDEDDFLGDLAKPVEEIRMKQQQQQQQQRKPAEPGRPIEHSESSSSEDDDAPSRAREQGHRGGRGADQELDRAIAQLVDYGFSSEDARRGLRQSGSGLNVQAAANWLLDDAHRRAKENAHGNGSFEGPRRADEEPERRAAASSARAADVDLAKSAAAVGSSLFKTANSLWKTGQKKMQQAVADFQQDGGDPHQPKWMRGAAEEGRHANPGRFSQEATDEALALESGGRPSRSRNGSHPKADAKNGPRQSRTSSPAAPSLGLQGRNSPVPRWQQQVTPGMSDARSRLSRMKADDDDSFSSYVSAGRRKKTTPTPMPPPSGPPKLQEDEPDLLFGTEAPKSSRSLPPRPAERQTPPATRRPQVAQPTSRKSTPRPPARQIPPIDPAALQASTRHRLEGTAHFKRGDYATAQSSYSRSLSVIPAGHPLMIVLLTNRALTSLKTGDVEQAITDADEALKLIGPANGKGESVAVQGADGKEEDRDMKELFGKALTRKAEALEQREKWAEAASVWQQCVEAGVGGATAIRGRQRCQTALAPKPKIAVPKPARAPPRASGSATASLAPQRDSEAVTRLREANEAAAREDDEKFALSEQVDAKVSAWRDGKRDNLRGLIASLDQVLWENSGWKKVGLHELVMANKVKISYMKAIAKTHPDKLPREANTEVRLIAGLVFATLNESWDKFKAENGM